MRYLYSLSVLVGVAFCAHAEGIIFPHAEQSIHRGSKKPFGPPAQATALNCEAWSETLEGIALPNGSPATRRIPPVRMKRKPFVFNISEIGFQNKFILMVLGDKKIGFYNITISDHKTLMGKYQAQLRRYFDFLDRDNDGYLNTYEAELATSLDGMAAMLSTGYAPPGPLSNLRGLVEFDVDEDNRVSFDEFLAYYAISTRNLISFRSNTTPQATRASQITGLLMEMLDIDNDKKLSRDELATLEKKIKQLDEDEDETVTITELFPDINRRGFNTNPVSSPAQVFLYEVGKFPTAEMKKIFPQYDTNKDGQWTPNEFPFDPSLFNVLDKNGDGKISVTELEGISKLEPVHTIRMNLGKDDSTSKIESDDLIKGDIFSRSGNNRGQLNTAEHRIELLCRGGLGQNLTQLPFPDRGKGYLVEKDLAGPQFQLFRVLFDVVDRDGDGRMTRDEFYAYQNLQRGFQELTYQLSLSSPTSNLFGDLDENNDGRLSIPEARSAFERLKFREPEGSKYITLDSLSAQRMLTLSHPTNQEIVVNQFNIPAATQKETNKGPVWFRKLDRNGDGVISRAEFPGTDDQFKKYDKNNDGYIDAEEAEKS